MADTITQTAILKFHDDDAGDSGAKTIKKYTHDWDTVADYGFIHCIQKLGLDEETLTLGADLSAPVNVLALIINNDATGAVEVGVATGVYPIVIGPKLFFFGTLQLADSIYVLSDTDGVQLEYFIAFPNT